jgi:hypothetical protein
MHLGFAIATIVGLILGQFLHTWALASSTVNSSLNGVTTYRQYIKLNAAIVSYRFGLAWAVFSLYSTEKLAVSAFLGTIPGLTWIAAHPIPVNPATALIYGGLLADPTLNLLFKFLARWFPALKVEVPLPMNVDGVGISKTTLLGVEAAKDALTKAVDEPKKEAD